MPKLGNVTQVQDAVSKQPRARCKDSLEGNTARALADNPESGIWSALADLMSNRSIGLACVMIPDKAPQDISPADDISTIGLQHGVIVTKTASPPGDAINVLLLVTEKLHILDMARQKIPNLLLEVLKTQDISRFDSIAAQLRRCRNGLAHPDPDIIPEGDIDLSAIPDECKELGRHLLKWDASPYLHMVKEVPQ
ncbi:hypothetical protein PSACC_00765 [Paramicrosporidium saccamoebae]|uniref:Uncharacterized protein n=1 Tax=Paramicrosporidium saccamoebae TaxID=1246581 RepID=A0A2H9TNU2_9FUNG|nr:hypothetical protein PSACC_00765 [Paramicrosporidium saccamoebae]